MKQRQFYRIDLRTFCTLRLRKLGVKTLAVGETFEIETLNISGGGMSFLSDRDLPVSPMLSWQLTLEIQGKPTAVLGQLVWKCPAENGMYQYGAQFLFFNDVDQRDLIKRLNTFQIRRRMKSMKEQA